MAILLAQLLQSSLLDKKKFLNERAFFTQTISKLVEYILIPETATIFSIENKTIKYTLFALEQPPIQNIIPSPIKNFFLDLFPINNHYLPLKNILGLVTLLFSAYHSYDKWKKNQQLRAIVLEKKNKENDTLIKNINECSTKIEKFLKKTNSSIAYSKKEDRICNKNIENIRKTFNNEKKEEPENAVQYENVTCLKEYLSLLEKKYFDFIEAPILTFDNSPIQKLFREVLSPASFFPNKNFVAGESSKNNELLEKIFVIYSKNFDINEDLINYSIEYIKLLNTTFLNIFFANTNEEVYNDTQKETIKACLDLFTEQTVYEFFLYQRMRKEIKDALESQVGFFNNPYRNINSFMFMIGRSIRKEKEEYYFRNIFQILFPPAIIISLLFTGPRKFIVHKMILGK